MTYRSLNDITELTKELRQANEELDEALTVLNRARNRVEDAQRWKSRVTDDLIAAKDRFVT